MQQQKNPKRRKNLRIFSEFTRSSRVSTKYLQTSLTRAEFGVDSEFDLYFEARGRTPEHKTVFKSYLKHNFGVWTGLKTPELFFEANSILNIKQFHSEKRDWLIVKLTEITYQMSGLLCDSAHITSLHFHRCFRGKVQKVMRELLDDSPFRRLCWFRQWIENCSISIFNEIFFPIRRNFRRLSITSWAIISSKIMSNWNEFNQWVYMKQRYQRKKMQNFKALKKLHRLIRNKNWKNLLCSGVRPQRSKWRPDLRSAWNSTVVRGVWSCLMLFEIFPGPPKK